MLRIQSLLSATLPLALCATTVAQQSPDEALRTLLEGNRRFAEDRSVAQPVGPGIRHTLARGQSPFAVVITCADSRVPPEHLFNTGLGELIVVRTAGHVIGAEAIATIEHAVERLNVPLCIVLGHEHCDVVAAAIEQSNEHGHQGQLSPAVVQLLQRIEPAIRKAHALDMGGKQMQDVTEEEHVHGTVSQCMSRSPLLRRFASVGKFRMVAARYHNDGNIEVLPNRPLPAPPEVNRPILAGTVPPGLPPHVALRMLRAGHRRFLGDSRPAPDLTKKRREVLAEGQQPLAIVLTDSDSRVSPEHIFDAGIGELFVIRTAGNTMTDETLASIEFAASQLGASLLVVMGHNRCATIAAAADHPEKQQLTPHQRKLLRRIEPSIATARADHAPNVIVGATQANVMRAVNEARSRSALLRVLEDRGQFSMLATYYDVAKGDLTWLKVADTKRGTAQAVNPDGHGIHAPIGHPAEQVTDTPGAHGDVAASREAIDHDGDGHKAGHSGDSHGGDSHGGDSHGGDSHGADAQGVHAPDTQVSHGDLPPAPNGEMAYHTGSQDTQSDVDGGAHGDTHGSARGSLGSRDDGNGETHDRRHDVDAGHRADAHQSGDHSEANEAMKYLKDPVFLIGISGIMSLLAAAALVLRRKS